MCQINAYLLPSQNYNTINVEDLLNLDETVNSINKNDKTFVPNEFYELPDSNGVNGADYLYGSGQSDLSDFLLRIVSLQKGSTKSYQEIRQEEDAAYTLISEDDSPKDQKSLCIKSTKDTYENGMVKVNDFIQVKRYYLHKSRNYNDFIKRCRSCYPKLVFHEDAFNKIRKLGKFLEIITELNRHLEALNDYGHFIYSECNNNEEAVLKHLESKCNITCCGKGSKEHIAFKKQLTHCGKTYTITCNSHTKFFNGNNNQRIYFSWGRDEIYQHNLIIISIGPHWVQIDRNK